MSNVKCQISNLKSQISNLKTHSLTHSLTYSLTHSLTPPAIQFPGTSLVFPCTFLGLQGPPFLGLPGTPWASPGLPHHFPGLPQHFPRLPLHFPGTSLDLLKTAPAPPAAAPVTSSHIELPFGQLKMHNVRTQVFTKNVDKNM